MTPDTFLSPAEVAELTDVRTGKLGRTREQLQIAALKTMHIPFFDCTPVALRKFRICKIRHYRYIVAYAPT